MIRRKGREGKDRKWRGGKEEEVRGKSMGKRKE